MRKIAILNQKGGTGKTTTTVNLGAGLVIKGRRVLLIDMDPQGNIGTWFNTSNSKNLYHLLIEETPPQSCIVEIRKNLCLLPSNKTAAQAELDLSSQPAREKVLKRKLKTLNLYDYILLDCAPSLNLLNQNAIIFADEVFIPVSMEYLSLVGIKQILENLEMTRELMNHEIRLSLIIPTFYDVRNRKSHEVLESLKKHFKQKVADPIRSNVKLSEAVSYHQTIFEFSPNSYGAQDYQKLVRRVENG